MKTKIQPRHTHTHIYTSRHQQPLNKTKDLHISIRKSKGQSLPRPIKNPRSYKTHNRTLDRPHARVLIGDPLYASPLVKNTKDRRSSSLACKSIHTHTHTRVSIYTRERELKPRAPIDSPPHARPPLELRRAAYINHGADGAVPPEK